MENKSKIATILLMYLKYPEKTHNTNELKNGEKRVRNHRIIDGILMDKSYAVMLKYATKTVNGLCTNDLTNTVVQMEGGGEGGVQQFLDLIVEIFPASCLRSISYT